MQEDVALPDGEPPVTVVRSRKQLEYIMHRVVKWIEQHSVLRAPDRPLPEVIVAEPETVVRITGGANLGERFRVGAAFNQQDNRVLFSTDTQMSAVVHEMVHWMQNTPDSPPGTEVQAYQLELLWLHERLLEAISEGDRRNGTELLSQLISQILALREAASRQL